jgi:hypothetical protein
VQFAKAFTTCKHPGVATSTYSFRASDELGARIAQTLENARILAGVHHLDVEAALAREIQMGLARALQREWTQPSDVTRGSVELVVTALEKVASDLASVPAYTEWDEQDAEGRAMRRGSAQLYAERIAAEPGAE